MLKDFLFFFIHYEHVFFYVLVDSYNKILANLNIWLVSLH